MRLSFWKCKMEATHLCKMGSSIFSWYIFDCIYSKYQAEGIRDKFTFVDRRSNFEVVKRSWHFGNGKWKLHFCRMYIVDRMDVCTKFQLKLLSSNFEDMLSNLEVAKWSLHFENANWKFHFANYILSFVYSEGEYKNLICTFCVHAIKFGS